MHVAGKVQVDVLHRQHLSVSAAGSSALDPEHGAERRLAQSDDRLLAYLRHSLTQAGGGGGFALARGCGVDRGDQNKFAVGVALNTRSQLVGELSLVFAVEFKLVLGYADLSRYVLYGQQIRLLSYFNI